MNKFFLLFCLCCTTMLQAQFTLPTPATVTLETPIMADYDATGSLLKELEMELTTTGSYANFTLYANDEILADNVDLPAVGTHNYKLLVKLPATGTLELRLTAKGTDITVESLTIDDYTGPVFPDFANVTDAAGIVDETSLKYGGPSIADMNNDGQYDLVLNNHNDSPSKLYMSDGDETFTKVDPDLSLFTLMDLHGSAAGDYDNDGDLDLIISLGGGNGSNPAPPLLYRNDDGVLVRSESEVGITMGARGRSPRWLDMDLDGDLDLILVNAAGINGGNGEQHIFYENLGDGTFQQKNVENLENKHAEKLLITDFNNDHIDDILMFSPLSLWQGNGDFTYTNVSNDWLPSGVNNTFGIIAATDIDVDNDGDLDLYLARGEYYFTVADNDAADFFPETNHLDLRGSGSEGTLAFEATADGNITISGLDVVRRNNYQGGYPLFLGSDKVEETLLNFEASLTISPGFADGFPTERTENGFYIGHVGNGVWQFESVRNDDIYWSIQFSLDGINSFTPDGWTPNNRNVPDLLLENTGSNFTNVSDDWNLPVGGNHWGVTTGDFNNDSHADLYIHRFGYLKNRISDYLLLNTGNGSFDITTTHTANNVGAENHGDMGQAFDYNLDGKVDILNGDDEFGLWQLYENSSPTVGNYVLVRVGYGPNTNVDPISAEVTVYTPDNEYFRRVGSAGEAHSQSLLNTIHFGLGDQTQIDSIAVRWRNGEVSVMTELLAVNELFDTDNVAPLSLNIDPPMMDVREGVTKALTAEILPINANKDLIWTSSNPAGVGVDENGVVSGDILGAVSTITATTVLGELMDSSIVTVVEWFPINVASVTVAPDTLLMIEQDVATVTATVLPSDADNPEVVWSSSDDAVATVDENGVVTAVLEGTAVITATTVEGGFTDNTVVIIEPLIVPFIDFDDENIYLNTVYQNDGVIEVNCSYHAGTDETVVAGNFGGIKYWLRELNGNGISFNNYTAVDATALNTESGTSTASIELNGATPTVDLATGRYYFLWLTFVSSDGNTYEKGLSNINVEGANNTNEQSWQEVSVHPMPVVDNLYLTGLPAGIHEAVILNTQGQRLIKRFVQNGEFLPMGDFPAGSYVLQLKAADGTLSFKVVKVQ